jgi:hypothetical protein
MVRLLGVWSALLLGERGEGDDNAWGQEDSPVGVRVSVSLAEGAAVGKEPCGRVRAE